MCAFSFSNVPFMNEVVSGECLLDSVFARRGSHRRGYKQPFPALSLSGLQKALLQSGWVPWCTGEVRQGWKCMQHPGAHEEPADN